MSETRSKRTGTGRSFSNYTSQPDAATVARVVAIQPNGNTVLGKTTSQIYAAIAKAAGKDTKTLTATDVQASGLQYCICETLNDEYGRSGELIPARTQFIMVVPKADRNRLPENMVNPENGKEIIDGSLIYLEGARLNVTPDNTVVAAVRRVFAGPLPTEQISLNPEKNQEYSNLFIERETANQPPPNRQELKDLGFEPEDAVSIIKSDKWAVCLNQSYTPANSKKPVQRATLVALSKDAGLTQKIEKLSDLRKIVADLLEKRQSERANGRSSPLGSISVSGSYCSREDDASNPINRVGFNIPLYAEPTPRPSAEWVAAHPNETYTIQDWVKENPAKVAAWAANNPDKNYTLEDWKKEEGASWQPTADEVLAHCFEESKAKGYTFHDFMTMLSSEKAYGVAAECRTIGCMPTVAEKDYTTRVTDPTTGLDDPEWDGSDNNYEQGFTIGSKDNIVTLLSQTNLAAYNTPKEGEKPVYLTTTYGFPQSPRGAPMTVDNLYYGKPTIMSVQQSIDLGKDLVVLKAVLDIVADKVKPGMSPEELSKLKSEAYSSAIKNTPSHISGPKCWSADLPIDESPFLSSALETNKKLQAAYDRACKEVSDRINVLVPPENKRENAAQRSAEPSM